MHQREDNSGKINDRSYTLMPVGDCSDIRFSDDRGNLVDDYLLFSKSGRPIIVSDHHQKLLVHIGELVALSYLANQIPIIDWLDFHDDGNTTRNGIGNLRNLNSLADMQTACAAIDCGQAAAILEISKRANFRFFENSSIHEMPPWGQHINPYDFQRPFARPVQTTPHTHPHIASVDLDHLRYFAAFTQLGDNRVALDLPASASYFRWLTHGGMDADNFDAVIIYTSPGYIWFDTLQDGIQAFVDLF